MRVPVLVAAVVAGLTTSCSAFAQVENALEDSGSAQHGSRPTHYIDGRKLGLKPGQCPKGMTSKPSRHGSSEKSEMAGGKEKSLERRGTGSVASSIGICVGVTCLVCFVAFNGIGAPIIAGIWGASRGHRNKAEGALSNRLALGGKGLGPAGTPLEGYEKYHSDGQGHLLSDDPIDKLSNGKAKYFPPVPSPSTPESASPDSAQAPPAMGGRKLLEKMHSAHF